MCGGSAAQQFRWEGLVLTRGLYVDIVERAECVTVEWGPLDYSDDKREWIKYLPIEVA